jgi:3',5'-cyclic AMP phosphodiesterase CpdA
MKVHCSPIVIVSLLLFSLPAVHGSDAFKLDTSCIFPDNAPKLTFDSQSRFKIVQFTDIHWNDGGEDDQKTAAMMRTILDKEKPQLVMLTGDILTGKSTPRPKQALLDVTKPMVERQIPWAYTFGNHDDECHLTRRELSEISFAIPFSVCGRTPDTIHGISNFWLPIYDQNNLHAATVYSLDSNAYENKNYDWIKPDQVQWYRQVSKAITTKNQGVPIPALAFFHIPLIEHDDVWNAGICEGQKHEEVCCAKVNSGLFAALFERKDVMGVYVGHDHVNDYEGDWYGIRLGYGCGSGYSAYGRDDMPRGARVFELQAGKNTFKTWLHLATGKIIQR